MKHVQKSAMKIELQSKVKFQKLNTKYCQKQIFEQPMPVLIIVLQKNQKNLLITKFESCFFYNLLQFSNVNHEVSKN